MCVRAQAIELAVVDQIVREPSLANKAAIFKTTVKAVKKALKKKR